MRGLAEFIMRGRWQALAVAVVGAGSLLFGWLSAAAIALVTLRKGVIDGSWLVLWALLPALLAAWMSGDIGSVVLLAGTFVLAVTLRVTVSLGLAILASVGLGLIGGAGTTISNPSPSAPGGKYPPRAHSATLVGVATSTSGGDPAVSLSTFVPALATGSSPARIPGAHVRIAAAHARRV